jgi:O6-methylguanine-DNA--protein-cysteine methyltransferase
LSVATEFSVLQEKLTGYSGGSGVPTKKKLLELEGIAYK